MSFVSSFDMTFDPFHKNWHQAEKHTISILYWKNAVVKNTNDPLLVLHH